MIWNMSSRKGDTGLTKRWRSENHRFHHFFQLVVSTIACFIFTSFRGEWPWRRRQELNMSSLKPTVFGLVLGCFWLCQTSSLTPVSSIICTIEYINHICYYTRNLIHTLWIFVICRKIHLWWYKTVFCYVPELRLTWSLSHFQEWTPCFASRRKICCSV